MGNRLPFTKMEGIGNDYVYINGFVSAVDDADALARKISDRHFGVGSDGLVLILPSQRADVRMRMFNADGSEAEMCGNASRCVGKFAWDNGLVRHNPFTLETGAGIKQVELRFSGDEVVGARVDMGKPVLDPPLIPVAEAAGSAPMVSVPISIGNEEYKFTAVSMGNPHAVVFMEHIDQLPLTQLGPQFEHHPYFPRRTNTEFVEVLSRDRIKMRVWERGAGETLACGTGACAALVASVLNGLVNREADVELLGGTLHIAWDEQTDHVFMAGPARTVFTGDYILP